jgi:hypothetical protein
VKISYPLAGLILIGVVGLASGLYAGDMVGRMMGMGLAAGSLGHEIFLQNVVQAMGTDDARIDAILEHLVNEERRFSKYGPDDISTSPTVLRVDTMIAYARLARIAKRQNKDDVSRVYLEKAISACSSWSKSSSVDECTAEKMIEFAVKLDKRWEPWQADDAK